MSEEQAVNPPEVYGVCSEYNQVFSTFKLCNTTKIRQGAFAAIYIFF